MLRQSSATLASKCCVVGSWASCSVTSNVAAVTALGGSTSSWALRSGLFKLQQCSIPRDCLVARRMFSQFKENRGYTHFGNRTAASFAAANPAQVAIFVGGGCSMVWWLSLQEVPYSGRRRAMLIPASAELALGKATFEQVMSEARQAGTLLPKGHPAQARVERIGRRIQEVASDATNGGGYQDHMQGLTWEFVVIDSDQLNAFVVPGGKVVVFKKMLEVCRTDDELASVIAHEAGHVLARHTGERMTSYSWMTIARLAFFFVLGFGIPAGILEIGLELPNSRRQETEADTIGMILAARACFDPAAGKQVFARLGAIEKSMSGSNVPTLFRTHPLSEARVQAIDKHLPEARQWAERSGCTSQRTHFYDFFR